MGRRFVAVQRYYKGNSIVGYAIQDITSGIVKEFGALELKQLISSGKISVANLKLTSDDRLCLITDDERINKALNHDGKSDNKDKYKNKNIDDIVLRLAKGASKEYRIIRIGNFNKNTNTFVVDFRTSKISNKNAQILFKYAVNSNGYELYINTVPMAIRFNGQTHAINNTYNDTEYTFRINYKSFYNEDNAYDMYVSTYCEFAISLASIICRALRDIVLSDSKAMEHLRNLTNLESDMLYHHEAIKERRASIASSAITYAAMFAIFVANSDPMFASILTATCGSFVNAIVQCTRLTLTDYRS